MAHVIALPCVGVKDTACIVACPIDCIHPRPDAADFAAHDMLYIDPGECIDCGLCIAECPVSAIFLDTDLPTQWAEFVEKNAAHFRTADR